MTSDHLFFFLAVGFQSGSDRGSGLVDLDGCNEAGNILYKWHSEST